jgi:hypothetical protein
MDYYFEESVPVKYDSLFEEVARYAVTNGSISIAEIQRNFEVGFNRAGRIMTQLERASIVSLQYGIDPRKILFDNIVDLEKYLESGDYHKASVSSEEEERHRLLYQQAQQEREKASIAERIKEKYRRQQLEKIVRQELIDSGELFGEQPKRPPIPREIVDAVYKRDGGRCVFCGSTQNLQLDHIIPFSKGGATTLDNMQLLCQKCNIEKSNKIG